MLHVGVVCVLLALLFQDGPDVAAENLLKHLILRYTYTFTYMYRQIGAKSRCDKLVLSHIHGDVPVCHNSQETVSPEINPRSVTKLHKQKDDSNQIIFLS